MNKRDSFYLAYFLLHIPITLLIDLCLVLPPSSRFAIQNTLVEYHILANKDFLLADPPLWLRIFGGFEILYQLPFFVVGAWALWKQWTPIYVGITVYGFNAFLTTLVCLAYVESEGVANGLTRDEVLALGGLYTPYLLIPLVMMVDCGLRLMRLIGEYQLATQEADADRKTR